MFGPGDMVRVDLKGDSLKNGALIGVAVGAVMGGLAALGGDCPGAASSCPGARAGFILAGTATWAAIGVAIDALIPGRTPLWTTAGSRRRSAVA
jgi:hypothetical protein